MSNLMLRLDGERIILRQRMHWAFFMLPVVSGVLLSLPFFVAYLLLAKIFKTSDAHLPLLISFIFLALSFAPVVIFLLMAIGTYLRSKTMLTNERFAYTTGLLFRRSGEITLENFQDVSISQSIPGTILNYGTITLKLNDGSVTRFPYLKSPGTFQVEFQRAIEIRRATLLRKSAAAQSAN